MEIKMMNSTTGITLETLFSLEGRVGIVTGASSGIGYTVSVMLASAGATVYNLSRTGETGEKRPNCIGIKADLRDTQAIKKIIGEIGERDGIDFLINNAGITKRCRAEEVTQEDWGNIHSTNMDAVFFTSQFAYPYLKQSSHIGRIVNIASMAAHLGFSEVVPYCSSKSAVSGITKGLAVEWAKDNILVNAISPGWFPSKMNLQVMDKQRKAKILARMPLHRFGDTRDIGAMALFLISDASSYITGQDFAVDGGALAFGF